MVTTSSNASDINLSDPEFWAAPRTERLAAFELLRQELPVSWQAAPVAFAPGHAAADYEPPPPYWAITRYADIQELFHSSALSTARGAGFWSNNVSPEDLFAIAAFLVTDPPRHTELRRAFAKAFTPMAIRAMEATVEAQAKLVVARVAERGECDFGYDLAQPFAVGVICEMLGVPESDRNWIVETNNWLTPSDGSAAPLDPGNLLMASAAFKDYGMELARQRRAKPADDLTTMFATAEIDGKRLSEDVVGGLFSAFTVAAIDSVAAAISWGMLALTEYPDERRRWQADYDSLAGTAIEEILRWGTPASAMRRTVASDIEVAGQKIDAGSTVILMALSANYDETMFDEPHRFDLGRKPNPHMAFSAGGIHFCIGAALTRLEMRSFFRELFALLPDIEISAEPVYSAFPGFEAFRSLPCSFTPAGESR